MPETYAKRKRLMPFDMDAVKRVPKTVWIVGGGIIVGLVILTRGRGGSGGATVLPGVSGGAGGGGSSGLGEPDQATVSSTDLSTFLTDQTQAQTDFYAGILDAINGKGGGASGTVPSPINIGTASARETRLAKEVIALRTQFGAQDAQWRTITGLGQFAGETHAQRESRLAAEVLFLRSLKPTLPTAPAPAPATAPVGSTSAGTTIKPGILPTVKPATVLPRR